MQKKPSASTDIVTTLREYRNKSHLTNTSKAQAFLADLASRYLNENKDVVRFDIILKLRLLEAILQANEDAADKIKDRNIEKLLKDIQDNNETTLKNYFANKYYTADVIQGLIAECEPHIKKGKSRNFRTALNQCLLIALQDDKVFLESLHYCLTMDIPNIGNYKKDDKLKRKDYLPPYNIILAGKDARKRAKLYLRDLVIEALYELITKKENDSKKYINVISQARHYNRLFENATKTSEINALFFDKGTESDQDKIKIDLTALFVQYQQPTTELKVAKKSSLKLFKNKDESAFDKILNQVGHNIEFHEYLKRPEM